MDSKNKTIRKKKAKKKVIPKSSNFGNKDKVLVTYQTSYYDIDSVPAIIVRAGKKKGFQYQVRLQDENGTAINLGHDQNQSEPGSGPFIFVDADNLELVEKYEAKRCAGDTKKTWKLGDEMIARKDFNLDQDDFDDITGVVPEMVEMKDKPMTVVGIMTRLGPTWLIDNVENYGWLPDWVDAVQ
jgi:hypothetical protein